MHFARKFGQKPLPHPWGMNMENSKPEPKILYTRRFKYEFGNCLRRKPNAVKIVVPYFGKTPFGGIVRFAHHLRRKNCGFQLITRPPSRRTNEISPDEALELSRIEVDLIICTQPPLHSKIYQFHYPNEERVGFVGSSNFSAGGFDKNNETVAFFQSRADNDRIAKEIYRISSRGFSYNHRLHE